MFRRRRNDFNSSGSAGYHNSYLLSHIFLQVFHQLHAAFPELEGLVPIALLPLGYPAEGAHPSRLHADRKPLEELVKYL